MLNNVLSHPAWLKRLHFSPRAAIESFEELVYICTEAAVCRNKTGDSSLRREVHEIIQRISSKSCLCVKISCSSSVLRVQDICIEASFLLQGCFLLLVAHILGSVVQLNGKKLSCFLLVLSLGESNTKKRSPLISNLTVIF